MPSEEQALGWPGSRQAEQERAQEFRHLQAAARVVGLAAGNPQDSSVIVQIAHFARDDFSGAQTEKELAEYCDGSFFASLGSTDQDLRHAPAFVDTELFLAGVRLPDRLHLLKGAGRDVLAFDRPAENVLGDFQYALMRLHAHRLLVAGQLPRFGFVELLRLLRSERTNEWFAWTAAVVLAQSALKEARLGFIAGGGAGARKPGLRLFVLAALAEEFSQRCGIKGIGVKVVAS